MSQSQLLGKGDLQASFTLERRLLPGSHVAVPFQQRLESGSLFGTTFSFPEVAPLFLLRESTERDSRLGQWSSIPQINGCALSHGEGDTSGNDKLPSNYMARPFQGRSDPYSVHL